MSTRSFTVFKDTADLAEPHRPPSRKSERISALSSSRNPSNLSSVSEKENIHPLTGELSIQGKKRKPAALGTKSVLAMKADVALESKPDPKRRKSSSSTSSKKAKSGARKEKKPFASNRKTSQSSRKSSPLPRVDEIGESEREGERIMIADIDSRCYELTVKPLADVSQAYEHLEHGVSNFKDGLAIDKKIFPIVKEPSAEPEIRDYFSPLIGSSSLPSLAASTIASDVKDFSTPERKQIYAAFTFSSPSKSPIEGTRSQSVPPTVNLTS